MLTTYKQMANSMFIEPAMYERLSEGQILTWREQVYSNLGGRTSYSRTKLAAIAESATMSFDEIRESITDRILLNKSLGKMEHSHSVFVMIDSCVLGRHALPTIVSNVKRDLNLRHKNLILVLSQINQTENAYKFTKQDKYPSINFRRLQYNVDMLKGKIEFKMKNIIIIETDLVFDNKILIDEEERMLKKRQSWKPKDRNEINDNAQLSLLVEINRMFGRDCILVSSDQGLLRKADRISQRNSGLIAYHY